MNTRSKTISKQVSTEMKDKKKIIFPSNMVTRSMNAKPRYDFVFDFDDSSLEWRRNKTSVGNGSYVYKK
jgi:hypothetical protein